MKTVMSSVNQLMRTVPNRVMALGQCRSVGSRRLPPPTTWYARPCLDGARVAIYINATEHVSEKAMQFMRQLLTTKVWEDTRSPRNQQLDAISSITEDCSSIKSNNNRRCHTRHLNTMNTIQHYSTSNFSLFFSAMRLVPGLSICFSSYIALPQVRT
jgi:hypothetical protein